MDAKFARIVTPTRTIYFPSLEKAFDHSDVMIEEHKVQAKDAVNGVYTTVGGKWVPDCVSAQEDTYGGIAEMANQWGGESDQRTEVRTVN